MPLDNAQIRFCPRCGTQLQPRLGRAECPSCRLAPSEEVIERISRSQSAPEALQQPQYSPVLAGDEDHAARFERRQEQFDRRDAALRREKIIYLCWSAGAGALSCYLTAPALIASLRANYGFDDTQLLLRLLGGSLLAVAAAVGLRAAFLFWRDAGFKWLGLGLAVLALGGGLWLLAGLSRINERLFPYAAGLGISPVAPLLELGLALWFIRLLHSDIQNQAIFNK